MADGYQSGMPAKKLRDWADALFTKRLPVLTTWQEIAENFAPLRADFTVKRHLSDDFAGNLMSSYPLLCQRELTDAIGTMLRNTNMPWFKMAVANSTRIDHAGREWLDWATETMRGAMYDTQSLFTRATKEADGDFAAFGQAVITVQVDMKNVRLLYRCWHLRDTVWMEDEYGQICAIFRRWKPTMRTLCQKFHRGAGSKTSVHSKVRDKVGKTPDAEVDCLHMMVMADLYDGPANSGERAKSMAWRSVYYDCENNHAMEEVAQRNKEYVIPQWVKLGSNLAHSPATTIALPEARLLQAMQYTLLEAGEKVVNPPMIAVEQVLRSDVALQAGGITFVDRDYDEKTGEALRALTQDARGMPLSLDMLKDSRALISQIFYLNRLKPFLPSEDKQMTAFQAGQIVAQYIRDALPLFEPMEAAYNGELCEETFNAMLYHPGAMGLGAFGSPYDMPPSLQGEDIRWAFRSPLHDMIEQQKGQKFLEVAQLTAQAAALDKRAYGVVDAIAAFRDAIQGTGAPTKWTRSEEAFGKLMEQQEAEQQQQTMLANMQQGADVAATLAGARKDEAAIA